MNKSFCYLLVGFLFFQNVNIISASKYSPHKTSTATFNNNRNEKKPKPFNKKKHTLPREQIDEFSDFHTELINKQKTLIDALHTSIDYLKKISQIICDKAREYWNKLDDKLIASELAVLGGDIENTIIFINNCICFLSININELASLSAEDMADWIEKINTHVLDLNQKNILQINIEKHSEKIRESAKNLRGLLL